MHFAVAGIDVAVWIPPVAAFAVSLLTSMGGVSGAFLLMPFQMSVLGYTSPSVSATNQLFNVVAIPSGVYRYYKEGRMVWPLTWAVILGTLPGVLAGAVIRVRYLPDPKHFKFFAGMVLGYIGLRMVVDMLKQKTNAPQRQTLSSVPPGTDTTVRIRERSLRRISFDFSGHTYSCSTPLIMTMSLVVGAVGGVYGIGGGSIVAPFFVSICGLPVYTVAGASLMGTLVTSVVGVGFYTILAGLHPGQSIAPDWGLGLLFGLGGMVGMYCGARLQKRIPAVYIKTMLCLIILGTALSYVLPALF
ncbi:sulfite exporter TauE/SafE family protein [Desulfovibrionales bacterium]